MEETIVKVKVQKREMASDSVVKLEVVPVTGRALPPWEPGAHVDFLLPNGMCRQYSLCGRPDKCETWRFGIARDEASRGGSVYIHDRVREGDLLDLRGPRNNFKCVDAGHYRFIAGGIGITPLLPMIFDINARRRPWVLHYGARRRASMAFAEELRCFGSRVSLVPQDEYGLLDVDRILADLAANEAVYCCGPNPLIDAVQEKFEQGLKGSLHVERFKPDVVDAQLANKPFKLVCRRSNLTVEVGTHETILDALERVGLRPQFSCREGTCGTCETTVLGGRPEHRDSVLSPSEKSSGRTMIICVSRSQDAVLELDI